MTTVISGNRKAPTAREGRAPSIGGGWSPSQALAEALACVTLGMVWMMVWRGAVRWLGAAGLADAIGLTFIAPRPIILAPPDLRIALERVADRPDWRPIAPERGGDD